MVSAVTAAPASTDSLTATPPPAGLDAALAKSQGQLADWVCCASAKTPAGKAKIAEISDRIDAIKAQMEKAGQAAREAATATATATATAARPGVALGNGLDAFA